MCTLIYSFIFPNRQTAEQNSANSHVLRQENTFIFGKQSSIRPQKVFLISTVVLLHDERHFIHILKNQTSIPTEKCFKLVQKPCGSVGKRKYNLNGINTTLRRHFRWKLFAFSEVSWIIVTGALKILKWCSEMLRMFTPKKYDDPWRRFKLACVTAREFVDVDCCTALVSPIAFWKDSERRPAFGKEPLYTSLQNCKNWVSGS